MERLKFTFQIARFALKGVFLPLWSDPDAPSPDPPAKASSKSPSKCPKPS